MIDDPAFTQIRAQDVLPPAVLRRVEGRAIFLDEIRRYVQMSDDDLLCATKICLRNLERLDDDRLTPDAQIRMVLVPEFWERIRPGSRDELRRITTTLAEYDPDRPSFFRRSKLWSADREQRTREEAGQLRDAVARAATLDARALVKQTRFAIAGSRASERWPPDHPVYEPGFTYRLVPAVACRALAVSGRRLDAAP